MLEYVVKYLEDNGCVTSTHFPANWPTVSIYKRRPGGNNKRYLGKVFESHLSGQHNPRLGLVAVKLNDQSKYFDLHHPSSLQDILAYLKGAV